MSSPAAAITIPERVTGKLPIASWDMYFQALSERLAQEFPESDQAQRTNLALGNLQIMACGNAAADSLAEFQKVLEKRGDGGEDAVRKRETKGGKFGAMLKRVRWRRFFDF